MWFPTSVTGFWTFFENYPVSQINSKNSPAKNRLKGVLIFSP